MEARGRQQAHQEATELPTPQAFGTWAQAGLPPPLSLGYRNTNAIPTADKISLGQGAT